MKSVLSKETFKFLGIVQDVPHVFVTNVVILMRRLFNRDLNRGCLVHMFSLRFSGSKFFVNKSLRDLQSLQFVFKITISKMRNLCSRFLFH